MLKLGVYLEGFHDGGRPGGLRGTADRLVQLETSSRASGETVTRKAKVATRNSTQSCAVSPTYFQLGVLPVVEREATQRAPPLGTLPRSSRTSKRSQVFGETLRMNIRVEKTGGIWHAYLEGHPEVDEPH